MPFRGSEWDRWLCLVAFLLGIISNVTGTANLSAIALVWPRRRRSADSLKLIACVVDLKRIFGRKLAKTVEQDGASITQCRIKAAILTL